MSVPRDSGSDPSDGLLVLRIEEVDPPAAQAEAQRLSGLDPHATLGLDDEPGPSGSLDADQRLPSERLDVPDGSVDRAEQVLLRLPETRVLGTRPEDHVARHIPGIVEHELLRVAELDVNRAVAAI